MGRFDKEIQGLTSARDNIKTALNSKLDGSINALTLKEVPDTIREIVTEFTPPQLSEYWIATFNINVKLDGEYLTDQYDVKVDGVKYGEGQFGTESDSIKLPLTGKEIQLVPNTEKELSDIMSGQISYDSPYMKEDLSHWYCNREYFYTNYNRLAPPSKNDDYKFYGTIS